jgi:6,7-dimethyl-8-ribityllumazine synthase
MNKKILIVKANYYKDISHNLEMGAKTYLKKNNFSLSIKNVPGIFEIPVTIAKNIKLYDGVIALGCVIKGQTPHFDYISMSTINGIMELSIKHKKPIGNAILTCLNKKQAKVRSSGNRNKGLEAAEAVFQVLLNA